MAFNYEEVSERKGFGRQLDAILLVYTVAVAIWLRFPIPGRPGMSLKAISFFLATAYGVECA